MDFTSANCLGSCNPPQILSLTYAISDITSISVYGMCDKYDTSQLQYSYSIDGLCWTCYMSYDECLANTIELESDFYIKIKVNGDICKVQIWDEDTLEYNTQLNQGFNFTSETNDNTYNPYANLESAIQLQQQLAENVSTIVGIPIYYFKLSPNTGSKDITFKEYALMDVEAVKQIKLVIADGQMPSSRPEFAEWGMDFQTDWETEVTKQSFATAFGINAQPMEGDLIYIPMMKRMWMVNSAYEEKNTGFMWQATTFKLMLTKYQEKGSVDLGDTEEMVNSFVKNKYEDLFGSDDNGTVDSGEASLDAPKYAANYLYPIFESDATRKYITCDSLEIENNDLYYRGTLISDSKYTFLRNDIESKIIYQKGICGDEYTCSFIINPLCSYYEGPIVSIGHVQLYIKQNGINAELSINLDKNSKIELPCPEVYICIFKVSKCLNIVSLEAYRYVYNQDIPIYKLQKIHYWFDMNQPISTYVSKYNIEYLLEEKSEVYISNLDGYITNFKLFDIYEDNLMDLLQMYPTHQHLIINDTARKIVGLPGATP